ncbi:OmpH family outer membrane protein [Hippea jasoniae]|uniref:OmpH family outer membrane protein n=1 Tax=Hippea jasoniae TaxID=944479 RepID=UPI000550C38B|nr:OmpH family outer membrane protein [Hippea jasoniae]
MKKLTIALVALFVVAISYNAFASTIAVVNLQKILQESKEGKEAKQTIQTLIEAKKIVIKNKTETLKKLAAKLKNSKLPKKEKDKLQKEYYTKLNLLQQYQANASEEVRQKEIQETNKILSRAIKLIKTYAQKHKIDAVFEISQGNVVYWNDALDITQTIIKEMDNSKTKKK